ncbi:MAG: cell division protein FtsW [Ruminococcaceae bacterium]|nr:cell division protein FtsW [Oscillospiraceae bacterium]
MAADSRTARRGAVPRQGGGEQERRPVRGKSAPEKKAKEPHRWWIFYWGGSIDIPMLVITLVLLVMGITMMFSASHALSYRDNGGDSYQYATKQVGFAIAGLIAMFGLSFVDYRILMHEWHPYWFGKRRTVSLAHILLALSMGLTALVIPFGIRNMEGGPKRWLPLPGAGSFQPSDILKVGLIIYLAYYIAVNYKKMRHFTVGLVKPFIVFGIIVVLLMMQPHLSAVVIMGAIMMCMLYIGGINTRYVFLALGAGVLVLLIALMFSDYTYFWSRIANTWDPLADPQKETYQTYQAVLAVGSGGLWGKGFDNSTQKYYYLPEAQNDFVYAVCCEEFGFIGGVVIILLFLIFVFRGFYIGRKSDDRLGLMLATGISLQVGLQAFLNIGVNVSAAPNTGISMPFFSYGGTALFMLLCEIGLMLSISRRAKLS